MGLTLFYDLRYPAERSRDDALAAVCELRKRATRLPLDYVSPVFDLSKEPDASADDAEFFRFCAGCLAKQSLDDERPRFSGNVESAFGFTVDAGRRFATAAATGNPDPSIAWWKRYGR
ncbi:MAG: hypothetical protein ACREBE_25495 [bacterium]